MFTGVLALEGTMAKGGLLLEVSCYLHLDIESARASQINQSSCVPITVLVRHTP